jgi:hypothetical protein
LRRPPWAITPSPRSSTPANRGELEGEITRLWFTNPHIRYRLTVHNEDRSTTEDWELQGGNETNLRRKGWLEDSIRVGDRVTVSGALGRYGAKKLQISEMVTSAGARVPQRTGARAPDRNAINASTDERYGYATRKNAYPVEPAGQNWRLVSHPIQIMNEYGHRSGRGRFKSTTADASASAVAVTASAQASAGTSGASSSAGAGSPNTGAAAGYVNGMQTFTMAEGGLMYAATIGGQRYNFKAVE